MPTNCVEILLREDDPNDVQLTLHAFKKYHLANHLQVVRDGAEALGYLFGTGAYAGRAVHQQPWVVLLDLKLPKVDGLEVLRRIRGDPHTQNLPVTILTSSREERNIVESYFQGVTSYLVKPVDFEQFSETAQLLGMHRLLLDHPLVPDNPENHP